VSVICKTSVREDGLRNVRGCYLQLSWQRVFLGPPVHLQLFGFDCAVMAGASVKKKALCLLTVQIGVLFHLQNDFRYRFIFPPLRAHSKLNVADVHMGKIACAAHSGASLGPLLHVGGDIKGGAIIPPSLSQVDSPLSSLALQSKLFHWLSY
jgi:hypothetical protein